MITEDYVGFEVAKLLKEKGFDIQSYASIKVFGGNTYEVNGEWITPKEDTIIPTLQMAMKWLREMYEIFILIEYDPPVFSADIYSMNDVDEHGGARHISPTFANHKSYEEACEAGIRYCLENLI